MIVVCYRNICLSKLFISLLLLLLILLPSCCFPVRSTSKANRTATSFADLRTKRSVTTVDQGPPPKCFLKYFLYNTPPQGLLVDHPSARRFICQSLPDSPDVDYFSTLFDEEAGIAMLSAYSISYAEAQSMGLYPRSKVSDHWRREKGLKREGSDKIYDGEGSGPEGVDKGHLNPAHINSFDKQHVVATFTYTNAVPQYRHFNRGRWSVYERKIVEFVTSQCAGEHGESAVMYLLTGTSRFRLEVGATRPTQDKGHHGEHYFPNDSAGDKIVRPNSMWTAGCCVWKEQGTGEERAQSIAVMGNNDYETDKIQMTSMTLSELEKILVPQDGEQLDLFPSVTECRSNSYVL